MTFVTREDYGPPAYDWRSRRENGLVLVEDFDNVASHKDDGGILAVTTLSRACPVMLKHPAWQTGYTAMRTRRRQ